MKKDKILINIAELNKLISDYKIAIPMLATLINMPLGTFKPKLNGNLPQYNFTALEYANILKAIYGIGKHLIAGSNDLAKKLEKEIISRQKHEKLS